MENATQALLIAGGVLIAMLILSLGVTMYLMHDKTSDAITEKWTTVELNKYNSTFWAYEDRTDISAQEIVSLITLSQARNSEIAIFVNTKTGNLKGNNNLTGCDKKQLNQFLNDHILTTIKDDTGETKLTNNFSYVKDSIKYDEETGKICQISFQENG